MKHPSVSALISTLVTAVFMVAAACPMPAHAASAPDVTIRINRIQDMVAIAEDLSQAFSDQAAPSPGQMLHGMLYGIHWIDPERSVVIGIEYPKDKPQSKPEMAALIPFTQKNQSFQSAYPVIERDDYYVMALPPARSNAAGVPDFLEKALAAAAETPSEQFLEVDVGAGRMLEKADRQIQDMLLGLDEKIDQQTAGQTPPQMQPEAVKEMLTNLIDVGRQLDTLGFALDIRRSELSFAFRGVARPDTRLSEVLTVPADVAPVKLSDYQPPADFPISLRTMPFDNEALLAFFNDNFGSFYQSRGMDLQGLAQFTGYFTGEMAGGLAVNQQGLDLEMLMVLKPDQKLPDQFIESVYIPWLIDYSKAMASLYQNQPPENQSAAPVLQKGPDSTVAGQAVTGITGEIAINGGVSAKKNTVLPVTLRMARIDDYLLMTSSDARMKAMMEKVNGLSQADRTGPLAEMHINLGGLFSELAELSPEAMPMASMSDLKDMTYTFDIEDGKLSARYGIAMADIKKFAGLFNTAQTGAARSASQASLQSGSAESSEQTQPAARNRSNAPEDNSAKDRRTAKPDKSDPRYWIDKGGLYATYGNTDTAIQYFKKALELAPQNSEARFHLALAYAEKGRHQRAVDTISRALASEPENGRYRYARGWIYQLAGKQENAMADMQKAAELGNADAKRYLEQIRTRK